MWSRNALGSTLLLALVAVVLAVGDHRPHAESPREVGLRINPNMAGVDELMLLPGIGPKLAEEIVAHRTLAGGGHVFRTAADLDAVKRIGPKTVERLRPLLVFDPPDAPPQGSKP